MPSPIAHTAVGYAIFRLFQSHLSSQKSKQIRSMPALLLTTVGLSLLPDLDVLPGILMRNIDQYHNNVTHSLISGLVVAMVGGGIGWLRQRSGFWRWFVMILLCYELHVIMDLFTFGRGVMLFWPLSLERYEPAVEIFHGLRRSEGWLSLHHVWTVVTELGFAVIVGLATILVTTKVPRLKQKFRQSDCH